MSCSNLDIGHMQRALELAARGEGHVEPNPMVGCVITAADNADKIVGEGYHTQFGGPHAEVEALITAGVHARGGTMYVTLEPCCHQGKTPPCSQAVIAAGLARVVVALRDPFAQVDGGGLAELQAAGIDVEVGLLEDESQQLNAPYLKRVTTGRPWVIAKWAMTLDGKIAAANGSSQWISGEASRKLVHALRGRVDAILIGHGTATADNPALTARPPGPRTPLRIVADRHAELALDSQLVRTAKETPVLVACGREAPQDRREALVAAGCDVYLCDGADRASQLSDLLDELGRRQLTNLLVEGGGTLLGALFDAESIDEVHAFIAPKLIGGQTAAGPVGGIGIDVMQNARLLDQLQIEQIGNDVYVSGRLS